jgi:hypothetical protein
VRYTFQQAKDIVLSATYDTLVYHAEYATFGADDIHKRIQEHFSAGLVRRVLSSLADDQLITVDQYDETSPPHYTLSDNGFEYVERLPDLAALIRGEGHAAGNKVIVPASDRRVSLDHNKPEYGEIAEALDDAIELAKRTKPNEVSGDEHASIVAGLEAARRLWNAFELSRMQFEIGILMAVERAETALKTSFNLVKGPVLMEALKAFYKAAKDGDLLS